MSAERLLDRFGHPPGAIEALGLAHADVAIGDEGPWTSPERAVVRRIVYACGDATIARGLRLHPLAIEAGVAALREGRTIVVDVRMVRAGLRDDLAARLACPVRCALDVAGGRGEARATRLPRAAVGMRLLASETSGGVVAVGSAPTALLALLDLMDEGCPPPALIVGLPVGFVAAAEAKEALTQRDVPFVTLPGTRGGSPLAAAAVNALLMLAAGADT